MANLIALKLSGSILVTEWVGLGSWRCKRWQVVSRCSLGRWVVGLAGGVGAHWVGGWLAWPGIVVVVVEMMVGMCSLGRLVVGYAGYGGCGGGDDGGSVSGWLDCGGGGTLSLVGT